MRELRDIEPVTAPVDAASSSGRNVITVIGIDRYAGWRRLTNAVSDARGAAALFGMLGFEQITEPLLDGRATGKAIRELVTDDLRPLGPDDSLVVFYAGHGGTREHRLGNQVVKTGYLIPVDASGSAATWIELDAWLRAISLLPAKHILVILDACHSGIALGPIIKWRDAGTWQSTSLSTLKARRSRRIIASALDDQVALDSGPVHGHSLFTGCLIEGLTHDIRRAGSRVTTGSELGLYLQRRVETYPYSRQTPDFGTFDFDERGEMVIPLAIQEPVTGTAWPHHSHVAAESSAAPPSRSMLRLAFIAAGGMMLGVIVAVASMVSRADGEAIDTGSFAPSDVTTTTRSALAPDAAVVAMPVPVPDAVVPATQSAASPAATTASRPLASAPKEVPRTPKKMTPPSKQELQMPPVPPSDGMLNPKL